MTPTNLPDLYSRVVAKRPELAASLAYQTIFDAEDDKPAMCGWFWYQSEGMGLHVRADLAAALILAKWDEAMPVNHARYKVTTPDGTVVHVVARVAFGDCETEVFELAARPTPLEALAAFWVECEA